MTANGRTCDEWQLKPGTSENHWLDAALGTAVAAAILGARLAEGGGSPPQKRERVSFQQMQAEARKKRGMQ